MTFPYIEAPALPAIIALLIGLAVLAVRTLKGRYNGAA